MIRDLNAKTPYQTVTDGKSGTFLLKFFLASFKSKAKTLLVFLRVLGLPLPTGILYSPQFRRIKQTQQSTSIISRKSWGL